MTHPNQPAAADTVPLPLPTTSPTRYIMPDKGKAHIQHSEKIGAYYPALCGLSLYADARLYITTDAPNAENICRNCQREQRKREERNR